MGDIESRLRAALHRHAEMADAGFEATAPPSPKPRPVLRMLVAGLTVTAFVAAVVFAGLWLGGRPDSEPAGPPAPAEGPADDGWMTEEEMRAWQETRGEEGVWVAGYFLPSDADPIRLDSDELPVRWKRIRDRGEDLTAQELLREALAELGGPPPAGLMNALEGIPLRLHRARLEGRTVVVDLGTGIIQTNRAGTFGGSLMALQFFATDRHYFSQAEEACVLVEGVPSGENGEALLFHDTVACPVPL